MLHGTKQIDCINSFEEIRQIADVIANVSKVLDVGPDVMANKNDVAFRGVVAD